MRTMFADYSQNINIYNIDNTDNINNIINTYNIQHPCPCGSGKKYKNCCGR